jgi:hypothetical protein
LDEEDFTETRLLANGRLIMNLKDGVQQFEFDNTGKPIVTILKPTQIVELNQSSIVLTQSDDLTNSECGWSILANGNPIGIEWRAETLDGIPCVGKIEVSPLHNIVPLMGCESKAMKKIHQFPWGYQVDGKSDTNYLYCGSHGEEGTYSFAIEIVRWGK